MFASPKLLDASNQLAHLCRASIVLAPGDDGKYLLRVLHLHLRQTFHDHAKLSVLLDREPPAHAAASIPRPVANNPAPRGPHVHA